MDFYQEYRGVGPNKGSIHLIIYNRFISRELSQECTYAETSDKSLVEDLSAEAAIKARNDKYIADNPLSLNKDDP
jgi:hypothetical protein